MKKGIILTVKCIALSLSMGMFLASCGSGPQEVEKIVLEHENMAKYLDGKQPKKVIVVPKRIVNIVV